MKIVLGSRSEGRKNILSRMGYAYEVIPADIDEKAIRHRNPEKLVKALAHAKASEIMKKLKGSKRLLITSDQVVVCRGVIREKPVSVDEALLFLHSYRTSPAETVTAVVVTETFGGNRVVGLDRAKIWFKQIPFQVIANYVSSGDPFLHAGGFDHRHRLLRPYVKRIEGEGESIVGLPLALTRRLLAVFGQQPITYKCLICDTTTPMPHICPAFE